jgi:hypothetical protein
VNQTSKNSGTLLPNEPVATLASPNLKTYLLTSSTIHYHTPHLQNFNLRSTTFTKSSIILEFEPMASFYLNGCQLGAPYCTAPFESWRQMAEYLYSLPPDPPAPPQPIQPIQPSIPNYDPLAPLEPYLTYWTFFALGVLLATLLSLSKISKILSRLAHTPPEYQAVQIRTLERQFGAKFEDTPDLLASNTGLTEKHDKELAAEGKVMEDLRLCNICFERMKPCGGRGEMCGRHRVCFW